MPEEKKLGKNQIAIFALVILGSVVFYYANNLINYGGKTYSDGILVGFLLAITFISAISTIFLWLRMLYLNWRNLRNVKAS